MPKSRSGWYFLSPRQIFLLQYLIAHIQTKAPQITSFELPPNVWKTGVPLSCLVYVLLSPWFTGAQWSFGQYLYYAWEVRHGVNQRGALLTHLLEALYVARLCSKHRTGPIVGVSPWLSTPNLLCSLNNYRQLQYVLGTFIFGSQYSAHSGERSRRPGSTPS